MSSPPSLTLNDGVGGQTKTAPFQSLKPSILIILLILSVTILVSVSVCLLLRFLNRHFLRQLSPSSSTATTTTIAASSSSSFSSSNRHSGHQHHNHRVSPETPQFSVLDSMPIFTFGSIRRRPSAGLAMSAGDCAVCLSKFEPQDQLRLLPLCCHAFHVACIDTWLESNQTCPLCRSPIQASESDILKALSVANDGGDRAESFRLEIGSVSLRRPDSAAESRASYSLGSFDYVVEEDSEISTGNTHRRSVSDKEIGAPVAQPVQESSLAAEVAGGRSWLKEYVDRLSTSLSSSAHSFRSSGRFFTGSSRRTELGSAGDYDLEANRVGEEISELFRWFSGV